MTNPKENFDCNGSEWLLDTNWYKTWCNRNNILSSKLDYVFSYGQMKLLIMLDFHDQTIWGGIC